MSEPKEIMNAKEAAEYLGFAPYTVKAKANKGEIPGKKLGRQWRFSRAALLAYIEGRPTSGKESQG